MQVEDTRVAEELETFKQLVKDHSHGTQWVSFHEGLASEWEAYKPKLREKALGILA